MSRHDEERRVRFMIEAARQLEPYQQGRLDGLCGLYAIINAIRVATYIYRRKNRSYYQGLFHDGLEKLSQLGDLSGFVAEGISYGEFTTLTRLLCRKASTETLRITFQKLPVRVAPELRKHNITKALASGCPVLLDLQHRYHYSVAVGCTASTITLFDSYGYVRTKALDTSSLTTTTNIIEEKDRDYG